MLQEQGAETLDLVVDPVLPQGPPIGRGVDGEYGLVEPELRDPGESRHGEVGADLHDGVDVRTVDRGDGVAPFPLRHVRDRDRARAFEADQANNLEAAIAKEPAYLLVADRHVRRAD